MSNWIWISDSLSWLTSRLVYCLRALRSNWKCLFMWWWAGDSGKSVWTVVEGLMTKICPLMSILRYIYKYILRNFVVNWMSCHSKPVCLYLLLWNTQILMQLSVKQDILVNYLTFYSLNHAMTYRMSHGEYILNLGGGGCHMVYFNTVMVLCYVCMFLGVFFYLFFIFFLYFDRTVE